MRVDEPPTSQTEPAFFEALVRELSGSVYIDNVPEWIPCTDWHILRDLPTMAERRKWLRKAKAEAKRRFIQERVDEIAEAARDGDELGLTVLTSAFPEDLKLHRRLTPAQRRTWLDRAALAACVLNEKISGGAGVVYFIAAADNLIKIGHTTNLNARLRSLRTAHPGELQILLVVSGSRDDEQELYRRFAEFRVGREWFKRCEPIEEYITLQLTNRN